MGTGSRIRNGLIALIVLVIGTWLPGAARATALHCSDLATDTAVGLAGNPQVTAVSAELVPVGTAIEVLAPPPGVRVPAGALPPMPSADVMHAAYCRVQFIYSERGGRGAGYAPGQRQHISIRLGLPLSSTDGGTGGQFEGDWNGRLENLV